MKVLEERANGSVRVKTVNNDEARVEQSHVQNTTMSSIVARMRRGIPPRIQENRGCYGDFSNPLDYHEAMTRVADAKSDFMSLPAEVRAKFDNKVEKLIEFVSQPDNLQEAHELGVLPEGLNHEQAIEQSKEKAAKAVVEPEKASESETPG